MLINSSTFLTDFSSTAPHRYRAENVVHIGRLYSSRFLHIQDLRPFQRYYQTLAAYCDLLLHMETMKRRDGRNEVEELQLH
jgi:hypothetical protein